MVDEIFTTKQQAVNYAKTMAETVYVVKTKTPIGTRFWVESKDVYRSNTDNGCLYDHKIIFRHEVSV